MDEAYGVVDSPRSPFSYIMTRVFAKADSLKRAIANQPWREFTTPDGRKYWNNTETKQSVWEMPEAYKNATSQNEPPPRPAVQ